MAEHTAPPAGLRGGLLRSVTQYLPSRRRLAQLAGLSFLSGLAQAAMLVLLVQVAVAATNDDPDVSLGVGPLDADGLSVTAALSLAVGLALVALVLQYLVARLTARISAAALSAERKRLFAAFCGASWEAKSQQRDGRLQELMGGHAAKAANAVVWVAGALDAAFSLLALVIGALIIQPLATGGAILLVAVLFVAVRPLAELGRRHAAAQATDGVALSTAVTEVAGMAQESTVFGVTDVIEHRMNNQIDDVSMSFQRMKFVGKFVPDLYRSAAFIFILVGLSIAHAADAGNVAALGAVVLLLLRALGYTQVLQRSSVHLLQLAPFLGQLEAEFTNLTASSLPSGAAHPGELDRLTFDHVSFEYESDVPALEDVSFEITAGETIGIVGPSGSGKSTLFQLLMRLRDPTNGRMLINGVDSASLDRDAWFRQIGLVPQDSKLFRGTVAENIAFFRNLGPDGIEQAARLAHIHDDITTWTGGYDADVGERGSSLSGGQRQRVYLARALAGSPDVLFLDEPTSALDVVSESRIQESLEQLQGHLTMFVIAHRLSTISMCDRIMVFEKGRLLAFDTREALEQSNPFYRRALQLTVSGDVAETETPDEEAMGA